MSTTGITDLDRRIIDHLQVDLPLVPRPYAETAEELGISESRLIACLQDLRDQNLLLRVGPRFDPLTMGGGDCLLALKVPAEIMSAMRGVIQYLPEIAHAHVRDHDFNVWCTLMTEREGDLAGAIERIRHETGVTGLILPKLLGFHRNARRPTAPAAVPWQPDGDDRKLILATQSGLPLVPHPFEEIGRWIGLSSADVIARLTAMTRAGVIRCMVAVPNRPRLGLSENALCAWEVPEDRIQDLGMQMALEPFVSRCSKRPPQTAGWPYNLYAVVYGDTRREVEDNRRTLETRFREITGKSITLFSSEVLKKRGLRLTMRV